MLNSFGKFMRKNRAQTSTKLMEVAADLGVSDSYLSAVEHGRRPVPDEWFEKLIPILKLVGHEVQDLRHAIDETKSSVTIPLGAGRSLRRDVQIAFAQFVADADEPTLQDFHDYMVRKRHSNENWKRCPAEDVSRDS